MSKLEYRYPTDSLYTGSSLGNLCTFARLSASTNLLGLWSAIDNQYYAGEWTIRILAGGEQILPVETVIATTHQMTVLKSSLVHAEQTFFLALHDTEHEVENSADQRVACFIVAISNTGNTRVRTLVRHAVTFPAIVTDRFTKQPPENQQVKKVHIVRQANLCTVTTDGRPEEVRVFGSECAWTSCTSDTASLNAEYAIDLRPGEKRELTFALAFSPNGSEEAVRAFKNAVAGQAVFTSTKRAMHDILSRATVVTPNPAVNRGLQWSKVNMIRVRHRYRTGESFTNDPPQDIVVIRDIAWFILGSDFFLPQFSRKMIRSAIKIAIHEGGKLTEYYHADERGPARHDYHLNINDDTPLFVWALAHHVCATGDRELASEFYPVMQRACDWILRQVKDGLVRCQTQGTNVWGICSWRNIIDDYNLAGAVTEINAECFLALSIAADMAGRLGKTDEAERLGAAAESLRDEINTQLRSEKTGLYLLNIDNDGIRHHDVTGDLIFPVLTGVADPEMSTRILDRLLQSDMWTDYGARTVSPSEPNFNPEAGYQLVGGVWPNLTAWIAYCVRTSKPEMVESALVNIYRISESPRPVDFAYTVPGEFPERLHGTDFKSRGMTLSPWTPPTYFWLGIEGLLGIRCSWDGIELNPSMPATWRWMGVKNLSVQGRSLTAFVHEQTIYASLPVASNWPLYIGTELKTTSDEEEIFTAGFLVDDQCILFAAADESVQGTIRVEQDGIWTERHVSLPAGEAVVIRIPSTIHSQVPTT